MPAQPRRCSSEDPAPELSPEDPGVIVAQGRMLEAVAGGLLMFGTVDELAERLGVAVEAFRAALAGLAAARWVFSTTEPDGRLLVGWERRHRDVPVAADRRRPDAS